jgi:Rhomboid family
VSSPVQWPHLEKSESLRQNQRFEHSKRSYSRGLSSFAARL